MNLPTSAKITVNKGAAGNLTATLNSNICSRSTESKYEIILLNYHYSVIF